MRYSAFIALAVLSAAGVARGQCWVESGMLTDPDPGLSDWFGEHVAIDGTTAAVGVRLDDNSNGNLGGAVRLYELDGGAWVFVQELISPDGHSAEGFGSDVAISGDWLMVAARNHTIPVGLGQHHKAGAVYLYHRGAAGWGFVERLLAPDHQPGDEFGASIDINQDRMIVGTPYPDDYAGAAYIYELESGSWIFKQRIVHDGRSPLDNFAGDVAIEGDTVAVDADWSQNGIRTVGAVYVFDRIGGVWTQSQRLVASDGAFADSLGYRVEIQDEEIIATTVSDDDQGMSTGAAYVFQRNGGVWTETDKLVPDGLGAYALFGSSVSVSGDMMLIGASGGGLGMAPARAALFCRENGMWEHAGFLEGSVSSPSDWYGHSVSLSGTNAIVGDFLYDTTTTDAGVAYVYDLSGCTQACQPDTNNDGLLTPADFNAWVLAFNAQAPECDQNGDGLCTPADFNGWILNFNAGCP